MAKLYNSSIKLPSNWEVQVPSPLDNRQVVESVSDLTNVGTWKGSDGNNYAYKGMVVTIPSAKQVYVYVGNSGSDTDVIDSSKWVSIASDSTGNTNIPVIDIATISDTPVLADFEGGNPTIKTVTATKSGATNVVGLLFQYSDNDGHVLTQEFHTHYLLSEDGSLNTNAHNHNRIFIYVRNFTVTSFGQTSPYTANGSWGTWTEQEQTVDVGNGNVTISQHISQLYADYDLLRDHLMDGDSITIPRSSLDIEALIVDSNFAILEDSYPITCQELSDNYDVLNKGTNIIYLYSSEDTDDVIHKYRFIRTLRDSSDTEYGYSGVYGVLYNTFEAKGIEGFVAIYKLRNGTLAFKITPVGHFLDEYCYSKYNNKYVNLLIRTSDNPNATAATKEYNVRIPQYPFTYTNEQDSFIYQFDNNKVVSIFIYGSSEGNNACSFLQSGHYKITGYYNEYDNDYLEYRKCGFYFEDDQYRYLVKWPVKDSDRVIDSNDLLTCTMLVQDKASVSNSAYYLITCAVPTDSTNSVTVQGIYQDIFDAINNKQPVYLHDTNNDVIYPCSVDNTTDEDPIYLSFTSVSTLANNTAPTVSTVVLDITSDDLIRFKSEVAGGSVDLTLEADSDDFTVNATTEKLQLADRTTDDEYVSKGYHIVRKNLQTVTNIDTGTEETYNVLTADMLQANSINVIRYDFDLRGKTVTIPEGVVLDFQGGSFSNGTVTFNDTEIKAPEYQIFNGVSCTSSVLKNKDIYAEWFGETGTGIDSATTINKAVTFAESLYNVYTVVLPNKTIDIQTPITITKCNIQGSKNTKYRNFSSLRVQAAISAIVLKTANTGVTVKDFDITANAENYQYNYIGIDVYNFYSGSIENVNVTYADVAYKLHARESAITMLRLLDVGASEMNKGVIIDADSDTWLNNISLEPRWITHFKEIAIEVNTGSMTTIHGSHCEIGTTGGLYPNCVALKVNNDAKVTIIGCVWGENVSPFWGVITGTSMLTIVGNALLTSGIDVQDNAQLIYKNLSTYGEEVAGVEEIEPTHHFNCRNVVAAIRSSAYFSKLYDLATKSTSAVFNVRGRQEDATKWGEFQSLGYVAPESFDASEFSAIIGLKTNKDTSTAFYIYNSLGGHFDLNFGILNDTNRVRYVAIGQFDSENTGLGQKNLFNIQRNSTYDDFTTEVIIGIVCKDNVMHFYYDNFYAYYKIPSACTFNLEAILPVQPNSWLFTKTYDTALSAKQMRALLDYNKANYKHDLLADVYTSQTMPILAPIGYSVNTSDLGTLYKIGNTTNSDNNVNGAKWSNSYTFAITSGSPATISPSIEDFINAIVNKIPFELTLDGYMCSFLSEYHQTQGGETTGCFNFTYCPRAGYSRICYVTFNSSGITLDKYAGLQIATSSEAGLSKYGYVSDEVAAAVLNGSSGAYVDRNALFQALPTESLPSTLTANEAGRLVYDTTEAALKVWDGTAWVNANEGGDGGGDTTSVATQTSNGLMSAADKTKLDTIEDAGKVNNMTKLVIPTIEMDWDEYDFDNDTNGLKFTIPAASGGYSTTDRHLKVPLASGSMPGLITGSLYKQLDSFASSFINENDFTFVKDIMFDASGPQLTYRTRGLRYNHITDEFVTYDSGAKSINIPFTKGLTVYDGVEVGDEGSINRAMFDTAFSAITANMSTMVAIYDMSGNDNVYISTCVDNNTSTGNLVIDFVGKDGQTRRLTTLYGEKTDGSDVSYQITAVSEASKQVTLTQTEYDALTTKDADTYYYIVED